MKIFRLADFTVPSNKRERKTRRILNNKINVAQPQKLAIMRLSNLTNLRENTNKLKKPVLYSA